MLEDYWGAVPFNHTGTSRMILELEYNEDLDEYFIVIPESMLANLEWEDGDMLEYEVEEGILRIFKI